MNFDTNILIAYINGEQTYDKTIRKNNTKNSKTRNFA